MDYLPLQIATILPEKNLTFDLFIHFKDQYLCYAKREETISEEKLNKLKIQKVARFYILKQDEPAYQAFLDDILNEAISDENITLDKKVHLVEGAAGTAVEGMQNEDSTIASYKITQKAAKSLREVIEKNPDALKKIYGKVGSPINEVIQHSLNVCALSTKLGKVMGLDESELDDLGTAALVHDIGITKLKKEDKILFTKPKKAYTPDNNRIYKFHCEDGVKMLANKSYVNETIIDLVRHHEENLGGKGPFKKTKLTPAEMILSLVNNYDKRVSTQKISAKQALKDLQIDEVGNYDLDLMNKFANLLKSEGILDAKIAEAEQAEAA